MLQFHSWINFINGNETFMYEYLETSTFLGLPEIRAGSDSQELLIEQAVC
jgi:hypothetical protein